MVEKKQLPVMQSGVERSEAFMQKVYDGIDNVRGLKTLIATAENDDYIRGTTWMPQTGILQDASAVDTTHYAAKIAKATLSNVASRVESIPAPLYAAYTGLPELQVINLLVNSGSKRGNIVDSRYLSERQTPSSDSIVLPDLMYLDQKEMRLLLTDVTKTPEELIAQALRLKQQIQSVEWQELMETTDLRRRKGTHVTTPQITIFVPDDFAEVTSSILHTVLPGNIVEAIKAVDKITESQKLERGENKKLSTLRQQIEQGLSKFGINIAPLGYTTQQLMGIAEAVYDTASINISVESHKPTAGQPIKVNLELPRPREFFEFNEWKARIREKDKVYTCRSIGKGTTINRISEFDIEHPELENFMPDETEENRNIVNVDNQDSKPSIIGPTQEIIDVVKPAHSIVQPSARKTKLKSSSPPQTTDRESRVSKPLRAREIDSLNVSWNEIGRNIDVIRTIALKYTQMKTFEFNQHVMALRKKIAHRNERRLLDEKKGKLGNKKVANTYEQGIDMAYLFFASTIGLDKLPKIESHSQQDAQTVFDMVRQAVEKVDQLDNKISVVDGKYTLDKITAQDALIEFIICLTTPPIIGTINDSNGAAFLCGALDIFKMIEEARNKANSSATF